ncbi:response regulator [Janthinobacterium sp.]|uniref:response regulator n=1 Tax=Janthinobacterium sp. TaxID=1871054 RepID=UPI0025BC2EF4|nr:response regulator [Janthinobacterium sp.]NBV17008.1 response regulator [Janthinobacterium sp.]
MQAADVCTTQQAAEILGISVTSVQQLVEAGVIEAWKTRGGHRRIPVAAVHAYKSGYTQHSQDMRDTRAPRPGKASGADALASILVIEDNPMERALYQQQIASWGLPARLRFCENGYQALMEIARDQPDILLSDIMMDGIDGYEVIRTILDDPLLADMHIAMLSSLPPQALEDRGGVPEGVVFFAKPVNYDELRGYLRACCAAHARRGASA